MLYVFYVDVGSMLKFDMNLATQSVLKLQEVLARQLHIPMNKQVLLVSGGENVTSSNKVSSYFAGTDTNPFFLFNKDALESQFPSFEFPGNPSDKILEEQLRDYLDRPPTMEVIAIRAKIVQSFSEAAKKKLEICSDLVHSQHLQHQGWSAVIANLLDITSAFKVRVNLFLQNLDEYLEEHEKNVAIINSFPQVLSILSRIPLLPCLPATTSLKKGGKVENLLDWINAHDVRGSLDDLIHQCHEGLQQYGPSMREEHQAELKKVEDTIFVDKKEMKVIKGLEDRLSGLEKLMVNVKKIVKEQEDMAKMFSNFHLKVRSLQDQNTITELCGSHKQYLEITLSNHHCLLQNTYKCHKTKHELCENLNNRLRWVMLTEQSLCKTENQVLLRFETLKKLRQRLDVVQQISSSPFIFCKAILEVYRRRTFAKEFLKHAAQASAAFAENHDEELCRRKNFEAQTGIHSHFLKSLFPGLDDLPSSYATRCPDDFDKHLPEVTTEDIVFLRRSVPELAQELILEITSEPSLMNLLSKHSQTAFESSVRDIEKELSYHKDCFTSARFSQSQETCNDGNHPSWPENCTSAPIQIIKVDVSTLTSPLTHKPPEDEGSATCRTRKAHLQSTSTSPDEAQNELFSTADFYFDESLQSSATTDPASSKKISELQLLLQERVVQLENKDKELLESKQMIQCCLDQITNLKKSYTELINFCSGCVGETKIFLADVKSEHSSFIEVIMNNLQENKLNFGKLSEDILSILLSNEETIGQNNMELSELKERLQNTLLDVERCSRRNDDLVQQLASKEGELNLAIESAKSLKIEMEGKFNQMVLENEIETDKLRSDFAVELRAKEDEISTLSGDLKALSGELKAAVYDKELCLEAMAQQFEVEKAALKDTLSNELIEKQMEKTVRLRAELKEEFDRKHASVVKDIESENRENWHFVIRELDDLKLCLNFLRDKVEFSDYSDSFISNSVECLSSGTALSSKDLLLKKFQMFSDLLKNTFNGLEASRQNFNSLRLKLQETEKLKADLEKNFCELQMKLVESLEEIKSPITNQSLEESDTSLVKIEYHKEDKCTETSDLSDENRALEDDMVQINSEYQDQLKKLKEEHAKHCEELVLELGRKHETEKKELLEATKSELEAERQILFNRALNQAVHDRDIQIDSLEKTVSALKNKIMLFKYEDAKPSQCQLKKIHQSVSDGHICGPANVPPSVSPSFEQSFIVHSTMIGQDVIERISALELTVKNKDQENKKLREKLMQLSMTRSSQSLYQDSINIRTCHEGSITLFVWDATCGHYIAYLVNSSFKYFLHSDSLEGLGIKAETSPHSSVPWIVAEVTSKECCQAKKASNRFKVPVDTKFYRVRAKPWSSESEHKSKKKNEP